MAEKRIYAGYYKRYDGKIIYVVTTAKDVDTGEETVIWMPSLYADARQYFTMSKKSFCGYVEVDGKRQSKFKQQTSMRLSDAMTERMRRRGFAGRCGNDTLSRRMDTAHGNSPAREPTTNTQRLCARDTALACGSINSAFQKRGTSGFQKRTSSPWSKTSVL